MRRSEVEFQYYHKKVRNEKKWLVNAEMMHMPLALECMLLSVFLLKLLFCIVIDLIIPSKSFTQWIFIRNV